MIPKVIHYCWFGRNPLPATAQKYIDSWKKYFPGYEIVEWNESNFDFSDCQYAVDAYQNKKWAFVSDYARFKILYEHGGLYFDVDVEAIRPMDDIVQVGAFMGIERDTMVAPGLGLGVEPGHRVYLDMLKLYRSISFVTESGNLNQKTVVEYMTEVLQKYGLQESGDIQVVDGICIYPKDYFCPMNYMTGRITITKNTRTIHHYAESWHSPIEKLKKRITRLIGPSVTEQLVRVLRKIKGKK